MGILELVQGPQDRAVSRDLAKKFLRVDTTADDDRIDALLLAAEQRFDGAEGILARALRAQTWRLNLSDWPVNAISLPLPPTIEVTEIDYLDSSFVRQTLSTDYYRVTPGGMMQGSDVRLAYGKAWPACYSGEPDAVRVTFDCGYTEPASPADNPVPEPITQAIIMLAQSWYDRPGLEDIPEVCVTLTAPFRCRRTGNLYLS